LKNTGNSNVSIITFNVIEKNNDNKIENNRMQNLADSYKYNINDIENLFALRFEKIKDNKILNKINLIDK
nr:hypothetical protein [Candidatus Dependentiae bacterium]